MLRKDILSDTRAFTFLELIISIFIFTITGAALLSHFLSHFDIAAEQRLRIDTQQLLRSILALMEEEIRMLGFNPLLNSSLDSGCDSGILRAEPDYFAFFFRQAFTEEEKDWKRVDYYLGQDKWLRRKDRNALDENGSVAKICENVDLNFSYLDSYNELILNPEPDDFFCIRAVYIELSTAYKDKRGRERKFALSGLVKLRNQGSAL